MSSHDFPPGGGGGSIDGPVSSTNNAVVRWDGTTAETIQDSGVIIDDSDNITGVNNLTVTGDLTVNGTTTTVNSTTLEVTDPNIIVNNGGNQATANTAVSGLTVEMSDATDAVFGYDSSTTSKFKCGEAGSEIEVATISAAQTITNKSIDSDNNTITNIVNADIKSAAAIALNKLAATTINRALVSDGSGFVSAATTTATEIGYVNGVTSAIQTQIDSKEATITGAATTITSLDLTIDRAVISNGSGKIAVSATTSTELGYVSGVTSAIQTQIDGKEATITGAATTITGSDLTASRALISNGSGKVAVSAVTDTELGYLDGVTSAVQTQLDAFRATQGNVAVSSDVTLTDERIHFVDTTTARSLALPAVSANLYLIVKDVSGSASTNNITLTTPGSETIDGGSTYVINSDYASVTVVSDGTNYFLV